MTRLQLLFEILDLGRRGQGHEPRPGRSLVDDVDGLVGKLTVGDVAVRQHHGGVDGLLRDLHAMMSFVLVTQTADDLDGLWHAGRAHDDRLKAPLQGPVLLDVLAVLVEGRGADGLDLTSRQGGLQHVGGVDGALGRPRPDERVQLIEEEYDVLRLADLLHHGLQALLELAAVLRTGYEGSQVELQQALVHEHVGHVVGDDLLGQPLDDGRLAHARLPDEDGIVLGTTGEDLDDPLDLLLAPDDGVELRFSGQLSEVAGELVQDGSLRALFGAGIVLVTQKSQRLLAHLVQTSAQRLENLGRDGLAFLHEAQEEMFGPDVVVAELTSLLDRQLENPLGLGRERHLAERQRLGEPRQRPLNLSLDRLQPQSQALQHGSRNTLPVTDQAEEDVLRTNEIVAETPRLFTCQDDYSPRPFREPFKHRLAPSPLFGAPAAKFPLADG